MQIKHAEWRTSSTSKCIHVQRCALPRERGVSLACSEAPAWWSLNVGLWSDRLAARTAFAYVLAVTWMKTLICCRCSDGWQGRCTRSTPAAMRYRADLPSSLTSTIAWIRTLRNVTYQNIFGDNFAAPRLTSRPPYQHSPFGVNATAYDSNSALNHQ